MPLCLRSMDHLQSSLPTHVCDCDRALCMVLLLDSRLFRGGLAFIWWPEQDSISGWIVSRRAQVIRRGERLVAIHCVDQPLARPRPPSRFIPRARTHCQIRGIRQRRFRIGRQSRESVTGWWIQLPRRSSKKTTWSEVIPLSSWRQAE
jgi:hypothetical protein